MTTIRGLYLSQTGMCEPLGRAQVLPYLFGLARSNIEIELISLEPLWATTEEMKVTKRLVEQHGLLWKPMRRSSSHHLGMKIKESGYGLLHGLVSAIKRRPHIIHARSHLPAAIADVITTVFPKSKLLFDCRGMLGDEYVDAGHWTKDRVEYKALKWEEKRLFKRADAVVVLTENVKQYLIDTGATGPATTLQVIPCCVDMDRFSPSVEGRRQARKELLLPEDAFVCLYSGSLGTFYREEDMVRFFSALKRQVQHAKFVILSKNKVEKMVHLFRKYGLDLADFITRDVPPDNMGKTLLAGDVGLSFIMSTFSKKGSSPTKVAEYLASGLPVVLNGDIGDQFLLRVEKEACVVLEGFSDHELEEAACRAVLLSNRPYVERVQYTRNVAQKYFSLEEIGVSRYRQLYLNLMNENV